MGVIFVFVRTRYDCITLRQWPQTSWVLPKNYSTKRAQFVIAEEIHLFQTHGRS